MLPNLLVTDITQAIRASRAVKMYICNVATQRGETEHFTVGDHLAALVAHVGPGLFSIVLANDNLGLQHKLPDGVEIVRPDDAAFEADVSCRMVASDLVDRDCPWRHDPVRLSRMVLDTYYAEHETHDRQQQ